MSSSSDKHAARQGQSRKSAAMNVEENVQNVERGRTLEPMGIQIPNIGTIDIMGLTYGEAPKQARAKSVVPTPRTEGPMVKTSVEEGWPESASSSIREDMVAFMTAVSKMIGQQHQMQSMMMLTL